MNGLNQVVKRGPLTKPTYRHSCIQAIHQHNIMQFLFVEDSNFLCTVAYVRTNPRFASLYVLFLQLNIFHKILNK